MSATDGPPAKQAKMDSPKADESTLEGDDTAEEGQEEWLSEGLLTDDDYNPGSEAPEPRTDSQLTNGDDTAPDTSNGLHEEHLEEEMLDKVPEPRTMGIEETLNHFEGKDDEMPEDLDDFLIKKTELKPKTVTQKSDQQEQDDGNDTDELLRMLSEDNNKGKKKLTKTIKDIRHMKGNQSTDDEEFDFKGATVKKLKMAKNATKSLHNMEDIGDGDDDATDATSDEEADIVKNMFSMKSKAQSKPVKSQSKADSITTKHVVNVINKPVFKKDRATTSTPLKQNTNKNIQKSVLKPFKNTQVKFDMKNSRNNDKNQILKTDTKSNSSMIRSPAAFKSLINKNIGVKVKESDEIFDDEMVDDETFNMEDDDLESELEDELSKTRHRIMRPGAVDEDLISDGESGSDGGSLYDELPSSDSEDIDDWFQLDIRAERAGDYLPLLGPKARDLLLEEKRRVSKRLTNLKQSLSALTDSGKKQAEHLRKASMSLAQIDDLLKAS